MGSRVVDRVDLPLGCSGRVVGSKGSTGGRAGSRSPRRCQRSKAGSCRPRPKRITARSAPPHRRADAGCPRTARACSLLAQGFERAAPGSSRLSASTPWSCAGRHRRNPARLLGLRPAAGRSISRAVRLTYYPPRAAARAAASTRCSTTTASVATAWPRTGDGAGEQDRAPGVEISTAPRSRCARRRRRAHLRRRGQGRTSARSPSAATRASPTSRPRDPLGRRHAARRGHRRARSPGVWVYKLDEYAGRPDRADRQQGRQADLDVRRLVLDPRRQARRMLAEQGFSALHGLRGRHQPRTRQVRKIPKVPCKPDETSTRTGRTPRSRRRSARTLLIKNFSSLIGAKKLSPARRAVLRDDARLCASAKPSPILDMQTHRREEGDQAAPGAARPRTSINATRIADSGSVVARMGQDAEGAKTDAKTFSIQTIFEYPKRRIALGALRVLAAILRAPPRRMLCDRLAA